jgi:hypothetical protein
MSQEPYDIFCSYDSLSAGPIVLETSQKLISKNWDVIVDRYQKLYFKDSKEDINRSKIFLCFFTTQFCNQSICLQKLEYAKKVNKRIIIILLENVNLNNVSKNMKTIVENAAKVIAYDQPKNLRAWFDVLFDQIRTEIEILEQMNAKAKLKYFRTTVAKQMKYDIFVSFETENKDLVSTICTEFAKKDFKVWVDIEHVYNNDQLNYEVEEAIHESRMVVCFVTKQYCASTNGQLELKYSYTNKRKCILVLLENFDLGHAGFGLYVLDTLKCNVFEESNNLQYWSENVFEKLLSSIRKVYCQLYVKEDLKEIDENNELSNMFRKFRRIVLECAILREKSTKLKVECNNNNKKILNERQDVAVETYLKSFENHNKAIQIQRKYVDTICKRYEEKQKVIIEKFRVYKQETKRFAAAKSFNFLNEKKRLKLVSQELVHLFERIKFLIREQLVLLDEMFYNVLECIKLVQIKDIDFVSSGSELGKIYIESDALFKKFQAVLEKQNTVSDDLKISANDY